MHRGSGPDVNSTHDGSYWANKTRGFDFADGDRVPTELYNQVLWKGIMGENIPYTMGRNGLYLGRAGKRY